jgi:cell division septum initiation protein DivIVA
MSRIAEHNGVDLLFEDAIFGYEKHQVDQYVTATNERMQTLAAEVQRLSTVEQELDVARTDIARLTSEMANVEPHTVIPPRLQQILRLAHDEAQGIRAQAAEELRRARIESQTIRANATREAADARRDFELALHEHRREQMAAADGILADARRDAERIKNGEPLPASTRTEAATETESGPVKRDD